MSLKKKKINSSTVKVSFTVAPEFASGHSKAELLGEFNGWGNESAAMKRKKDGSFSLTMNLPTGRDYEFRYLLDENFWINDEQADRYQYSPFGNCENSVISL